MTGGEVVTFQSGSLLGSVIKVDFTMKDSSKPVRAQLIITACAEHLEAIREVSTQVAIASTQGPQVSTVAPCPLVDLMTDPVVVSSSNIQTSSNSKEKDNLFGGDSPWTSEPGDIEPRIQLTLSKSRSVTITEVRLVDPDNIQSFVVTVQDASGNTVTETVSASSQLDKITV